MSLLLLFAKADVYVYPDAGNQPFAGPTDGMVSYDLTTLAAIIALGSEQATVAAASAPGPAEASLNTDTHALAWAIEQAFIGALTAAGFGPAMQVGIGPDIATAGLSAPPAELAVSFDHLTVAQVQMGAPIPQPLALMLAGAGIATLAGPSPSLPQSTADWLIAAHTALTDHLALLMREEEAIGGQADGDTLDRASARLAACRQAVSEVERAMVLVGIEAPQVHAGSGDMALV